MSSDNWRRQQLKSHDQARLAGRADRATRTSVHGIIPGRFFAAASSECRDIFIDGITTRASPFHKLSLRV